MSLRVNTNTMAFNAYRNLTATDGNIGKAVRGATIGTLVYTPPRLDK